MALDFDVYPCFVRRYRASDSDKNVGLASDKGDCSFLSGGGHRGSVLGKPHIVNLEVASCPSFSPAFFFPLS